GERGGWAGREDGEIGSPGNADRLDHLFGGGGKDDCARSGLETGEPVALVGSQGGGLADAVRRADNSGQLTDHARCYGNELAAHAAASINPTIDMPVG